MIKAINKKVENNELIVEVTCAMRKFATHPIKCLTTEELVGILNKEYKIDTIKTSPGHKVGNSKRHRMRLSGTWVFSLKTETKTRQRKKPQSKKKETTPPTEAEKTKTPTSTKGIRSRMSALTKNK